MFTFVVKTWFFDLLLSPFSDRTHSRNCFVLLIASVKKVSFSSIFLPCNQRKTIPARTRLIEAGPSVTREKCWTSLITPLEALFCAEIGEHEVKEAKKRWPKGRLSRLSVFVAMAKKSSSGFYRLSYWLYSRENVERDAKSGWMALFLLRSGKRVPRRKWKFLYFCARHRHITPRPHTCTYFCWHYVKWWIISRHTRVTFSSRCVREKELPEDRQRHTKRSLEGGDYEIGFSFDLISPVYCSG